MNDVFISYSRSDATWAQKLRDDLAAPGRGLKVFLDTAELEGGAEWEKQLAVNLNTCRNLALLWSTNAAASKWVDREASLFRSLMLLDEDAGAATNRRILQICMNARNSEYERWQTLEDIHDAALFNQGVANVDPNKWQSLLKRIMDAVRVDDTSPEIQVLYLASTRERMAAVDLHATLDGELEVGTLLKNLGLSHPGFLDCYGPDRSDWRPFAGRENVVTLLAQLRTDLIAAKAPHFRWKPVERDFWDGSQSDVDRIVKRLSNEPSVIVIDLLSLYDAKVFGRYRKFMNEEYLYKPYTCLAVLPPVATDGFWSIQNAVRQVAQEVYDKFYLPVFDEKRVPLASFSALVSHPCDVQRLLAAALRRSRTERPQWWSAIN